MTKEKTPLKWKFRAGDSVSSLAVVDGVVYFGSWDNHLYALDTKTGEEKWKFKTGDLVNSSPAVVDGVVYFGSCDKHLYAVDIKTGEEKWKFKAGDNVYNPAVLDGAVYFGSDDNHLYAVDIKTGEEKWRFKTGSYVYSTPAVVDGVVYFGSWDNHLYAVDIELAEKFVPVKKVEEERQKDSDGIVYEENTLLKRDLLYACWNNGPADDIYKQSYETEVTHEQADYIENQGLGCTRFEEFDPDADDYDPEETEKIEIDVEDYVDNDFKNDFFSRFDTDELESGEISKEEIEDWINSSVGRLCELFRSFTIHDEDQIYLQVESKEYKLEDLDSDWTDDKYYLDDKKMEYFINTSMEDW